MKKHKKAVQWVKEHWAHLVVGGISVGIATYFVVSYIRSNSSPKVPSKLVNAPDLSCEIDAVYPVNSQAVGNASRTAFPVSEHIRKLSGGRHPSAEKIATAAENGFKLEGNQTWVKPYTKGLSAA